MHKNKVELLRKQLKQQTFHTLSKTTSNTLRKGCYKKNLNQINLSSFNEILHIEGDFAWVEPKVTIFQLVQETLKWGMIPAVVPEFKSITVGGAIMGAALESSSFRYGQFNDSCLEYELLLGDGSQITASANEHADLFYGMSGSYGSLALLTAVKIQLIRSKPYVVIEHKENFPDQGPHFCDGIAFSKDEIITMEGEMVNTATKPITGSFFKHLLKRPKQSCLAIEDYLFRFDKGAFWMGKHLPFGMSLPSEKLYRYLHRMPAAWQEKYFLIHDFYAPRECAKKVFDQFAEKTKIYPIWLCPVKGTLTSQILAPHFGKNSFVNIGIYGKLKHSASLSTKLEKDILTFGGRKMLYSLNYYSEATFNQEYESEQYKLLRKKYHAESAFPRLFHKVCQKSTLQKSTTSGTT